LETLEDKLKHLPLIAKRKLIAQMKTKFRRELAERQFTMADLHEIFGLAIKGKIMEKPTRHQMPGKHFTGSRHADGSYPAKNPTLTKLVRMFIRTSGGESSYNRSLYAVLTGHQYQQEASDATGA
jgi:hypothetical protein